jgi:hypothetical protein
MNRQDILQMGRQAGSFIELAQEKDLLWLERFAALVASAERERLAKVFDELDKGIGFYDPHEPAEIIRSRGPKPPDSV